MSDETNDQQPGDDPTPQAGDKSRGQADDGRTRQADDEPKGGVSDRERELRAPLEEAPTIPVSEFRKRSRRSFILAGVAVGAGFAGWRWLQSRPEADGIPRPLRSTLEFNEALWSDLAEDRLAPEYPQTKATPIQVNGQIGIEDEIDLSGWTVRVEGPDGELLDELDIATFEALPQQDMIIEHKCIEGWSSIVHWGGARFSDFHARYADQLGDVPYVGFETPDGLYYVGWDMPSALHPQTMLALRQGSEPLTQIHGAPLRLATPNKYGIKCLKRIGVIRYARERPADYWAERSYDWYAGL